MNVLCVGNSFAVDASTYVHEIAKCAGYHIDIHVLYIPGCPINLHWKNFNTKEKAYEFYVNGEKTPTMYPDIFEGLAYKKYEYITFQQRSGDSVDSKTFFPELTLLMDGIRKYSNATYLLHKTWSYAKEFSHERYGSNPMDQTAMDKDIKQAYIEASKISGIPYIIPSGEAIKLARECYGDFLTRDGYHLNERARTLVGILWVLYFTNAKVDDIFGFAPSGYSYDEVTPPVDKEELNDLLEIAKNAIDNNKGYNIW